MFSYFSLNINFVSSIFAASSSSFSPSFLSRTSPSSFLSSSCSLSFLMCILGQLLF